MARYRRLLAIVLLGIGAGVGISFYLVVPAMGWTLGDPMVWATSCGLCLGIGLRFLVVDRMARRSLRRAAHVPAEPNPLVGVASPRPGVGAESDRSGRNL